ncbi:RNA polymerase sigma factor [Sphingomonas sp.]|uniref:RNA polymerase sigma factor n=1 Tax=Sphingomonas sp. TaxID=28214 RepID=UPI002C4966AD|nr:RNA polymerase sigma factor [Sphingomonas sp.]HWK36047.1 RNA polymerase sigma factor [Sphingomonas sp.]
MAAAAKHPRLEEVAAEYRAPLLRFFQRRVEPGEDADDLVQDVFSRLAGRDLAAIANIQGYLFQVAANVLRDKARRASVRGFIVSAPDGLDIEDEAGFSPERILESREALQVMIAAIQELPEKVRIVFSHYHFDGVAQVEIARCMGLSLSTVEKHMARANSHLLYRLRNNR